MNNVQAKPRRRWTRAEWQTFIGWMSTLSCFFLMGFIVGHLW